MWHEKDEGRGRPSLVDNDHLKELVEENPRTAIYDLALVLDVDATTVLRHL